MFRAPSVNSLNSVVVPLYWKCEVAGVITYLYLLQKPTRIVSEPGSLVKILIHFLEKRETFGFHDAQPECRNGFQVSVIGYQLQEGVIKRKPLV